MRPRCKNCGRLKNMEPVVGTFMWLCPAGCPRPRFLYTDNTAPQSPPRSGVRSNGDSGKPQND
jgi:hypothetical protein